MASRLDPKAKFCASQPSHEDKETYIIRKYPVHLTPELEYQKLAVSDLVDRCEGVAGE